MPDSNGVKINGKNLSTWLAIGVIAVGSIVDSALTRDQVRRNTTELETHNLDIIEYKLDDIEQTVHDINAKTDEIFRLAQDYFMKQ